MRTLEQIVEQMRNGHDKEVMKEFLQFGGTLFYKDRKSCLGNVYRNHPACYSMYKEFNSFMGFKTYEDYLRRQAINCFEWCGATREEAQAIAAGLDFAEVGENV